MNLLTTAAFSSGMIDGVEGSVKLIPDQASRGAVSFLAYSSLFLLNLTALKARDKATPNVKYSKALLSPSVRVERRRCCGTCLCFLISVVVNTGFFLAFTDVFAFFLVFPGFISPPPCWMLYLCLHSFQI